MGFQFFIIFYLPFVNNYTQHVPRAISFQFDLFSCQRALQDQTGKMVVPMR
jgi:hypothetical protein